MTRRRTVVRSASVTALHALFVGRLLGSLPHGGLALLGLTGAAVGGFGLMQPVVALALLLVVHATNVSPVLGLRLGHAVASLVFWAPLGLTAGALAIGLRRRTLELVWSPVLTLAVVFLAARTASVLVADDPWTSLGQLKPSIVAVAALVVVTTVLSSTRSHEAITKVLLATLAGLAGLSVAQEFLVHNHTDFFGFSGVLVGASHLARHTGPEGDPNFWARTLVLFLPLALSVAAQPASRRGRVVWLAASVLMVQGLLLTQSRGGILAGAVAAVVWVACSGVSHRRLILVAPVALVGLLTIPGVQTRLATLSDLRRTSSELGDTSLVERLSAQRAGVAIFSEHPVLGVGAGTFEKVEPHFLLRTGFASAVVTAPHNIYLEMAAESGVVGLAAWLLFFGAALFVAIRAAAMSRYLGPGGAQTRGLAVGVAAGLVGWALASLFLHLNYSLVLMALIALGASLDIDVRRALPRPTTVVAGTGSGSRRPGRRRAVARTTAAQVAVVIASISVAFLVFRGGRRHWEADASAVVRPVDPGVPAALANRYDLLTRELVVPTFAVVAREPGFAAGAGRDLGLDGDRWRRLDVRTRSGTRGAVVTMSVSTTQRQLSRTLADHALGRVRDYVASLGGAFELTPLPAPRPTSRPVARPRPLPAAAVVAAGAVAAGGIGRLRPPARNR